MTKFVLLLASLTFASASPTIVPHFEGGQIFIPFFQPSQFEEHNYPFHHPIDRADQENHQHNYGPDHGASYAGFDNHDQHNNAVVHEDESQVPNDFSDHAQHDYSAFTDFNSKPHESHDDAEKYEIELENHQHNGEHHYVQSVPVSEHVEVTKPIAVPVYKEIGVPVPHPVKINVPHPVTVGVPQPYPVAVPVAQHIPIQITKTVAVPVEKKVPYPVEKHIPVPVEKLVPIKIEKHIPVPVYKPYPIKIPVYKTIYHHSKEQTGHSHGHSHQSSSHDHGHGR